MEITLTLQPAGGSATEIRIRAAPGTALAAVHGALGRAAGLPGATLYAGSRRLPAEAVLGGPGLQAGDVIGVGSPGPRCPEPAGVLELGVVGGPDAGGIQPLGHGEVLIGRSAAASVQVCDPDVSRRHAAVALSSTGVTVRDLKSTNGTWLDGTRVGQEPLPLLVDQQLRVGETTLALSTAGQPPASVRTIGDGTVAVHRPPRLAAPQADVEVEMPAEPPVTERGLAPLIASLVPAGAAVLAGTLTQSGLFVALGLLSPALFVLGALVQRRSHSRRRARDVATYQAALDRSAAALADAVRDEERLRRTADPDPAAVRRIARGPASRVWERRPADPDFCRVRLGTADLPARVLRRGAGSGLGEPETATSVPVTVALPTVGVLGIAGPLRPTGATTRFLVAALATLHGPRDLTIVLLIGRSVIDDWSWARWLPHLRRGGGNGPARVGLTVDRQQDLVAELVRELEARQTDRSDSAAWRGPCMLTVLDRWSELRDLPGVGRLLVEGPPVGMLSICVDGSPQSLPAGCGAVAEVTGATGTRLRIQVSGQPTIEGVVADGVSQSWSDSVARSLAPLIDDGIEAGATLPRSCRLLDLLGLEPPDPAAVLAGWQQAGRTTRATIGATAEGPFTIDLKADGPHALIAGTTGAGKSELLQTLIASLASTNRPDTMTFVLIDYKGGAAFKDASHLPHVLGMVTDLDPHLTQRALRSLTAELKRREQVLAAARTPDIDTYHTTPSAGLDPLPRLLLVIDEFATLADELPDFITGLIGVAARGRSLGIHLILATQRPTGVVSPTIRANTNLRIALRVTDDAESHDVIDTKHAASISKATPGRGYLRIAGSTPVEFQTARVGGRGMRAAGPPTVTPAPWRTFGRPEPPAEDHPTAGTTDLQRLVSAIGAAAAAGGILAPPSPWLPPLPPLVTVDDLDLHTSAATAEPAVESERLAVPLGLADRPADQRQNVFAVDIADGRSLLVAGSPRSGRSTVLRTLAAGAARRWPADDIHLYALDCGSGMLHLLTDLPHCGAVVQRDETACGDRVLARLLEEVRGRQDQLARGGYGSFAELRQAAARHDRLPWLLLLLDGWEGFVANYEAVDHGRPVTTLLGLAREGPAVGLKVAVTSDRQGLLTRLGAVFAEKLLLRLTDRLDYGLAGIPTRAVPEQSPPGRGLLATDATEVQVALLDRDPRGPAQSAAFTRIVTTAMHRAAADPPTRRPFHVRPLPRQVRLADLAGTSVAPALARCAGGPLGVRQQPVNRGRLADARVSEPSRSPTTDPADYPTPVRLAAGDVAAPRRGSTSARAIADAAGTGGRPYAPSVDRPFWTLVGAGGDDAGPVGVDLARDGPGFLLAGPARSGRSTALRTLGHELQARGRPIVLVVGAQPPESLAGIDLVAVLGPADGPRLTEELAAGRTAVLVDDVTALVDTSTDHALVDLLRSGGHGHVVIAAGRTNELITTFRGTAAEVRRSQAGLLLCPTWTDGELLGARLPRGDPETIPGRGVLIAGGRQTPVQVAVADDDSARPGLYRS